MSANEPITYPALDTPTTKSPSTKSNKSSTSINQVEIPVHRLARSDKGTLDDERTGEHSELLYSKKKRFFLLFLFSVAQVSFSSVDRCPSRDDDWGVNDSISI